MRSLKEGTATGILPRGEFSISTRNSLTRAASRMKSPSSVDEDHRTKEPLRRASVSLSVSVLRSASRLFPTSSFSSETSPSRAI